MFRQISDVLRYIITDEKCNEEFTDIAEQSNKEADDDIQYKDPYPTGNIYTPTVNSSGANNICVDKNVQGNVIHRKTGNVREVSKTKSSTSKSYIFDSSRIAASTFHSETNNSFGETTLAQWRTLGMKTGAMLNDTDIVDENGTEIAIISNRKLWKDGNKLCNKSAGVGDIRARSVTDRIARGISQWVKPTNEEMPHNFKPLEKEQSILLKDPKIKTVGDALEYFKLNSGLRSIEKSLERVRRRKMSRQRHEFAIKQFDKEIQKLSFRFHPDKVKNRGESEEEVAKAQNLQTALNATRTVLSVLNEMFLEDINTDHRFGYYTKLNISSLGNEDEIKKHVYDVVFKISFISKIKQQDIIAEIQQFLIEGKNCVKHFFAEEINEFDKCRISSLFHLKKCIKGHKKLLIEIRTVKAECENENLDNISSLLSKMSREFDRYLLQLKVIKKVAKKSLDGSCYFYSTEEKIDDYFVTPFATYMNIIIMCNVILKNGNRGFFPNCSPDPVYNEITSSLCYLYYLASFLSGNKHYKDAVEHTLGVNPTKKAIKEEFNVYLSNIYSYFEKTFKVEDYYTENTPGNFPINEHKKYMSMMVDFKTKERELKNSFKQLNNMKEEMEEKYINAMKENEEFNNKFKESLEQSRLLREEISASLLGKK